MNTYIDLLVSLSPFVNIEHMMATLNVVLSVVSLFVFIAMGLFIMVYALSRPLTYEIDLVPSLSPQSPYDDGGAAIAQIKISNGRMAPVELADYITPLQIRFPEGTEIVDVFVSGREGATLQVDGHNLRIGPTAFDVKETLAIRTVLVGEIEDTSDISVMCNVGYRALHHPPASMSHLLIVCGCLVTSFRAIDTINNSISREYFFATILTLMMLLMLMFYKYFERTYIPFFPWLKHKLGFSSHSPPQTGTQSERR